MAAAMKAKDKPKKDAVSSLIAAIKKVTIDEDCRDDIPEELVDRLILKEIKAVTEQVVTCPDERVELKAEYKGEADGKIIKSRGVYPGFYTIIGVEISFLSQ